MITVQKTYRDLPAAHRQPAHDGHCKLIHGHNWAFDLVFGCTRLDGNGFVVDVGKLERVKEFIDFHFDHTLLLNTSDPQAERLVRSLTEQTLEEPLARIVLVPNCGMEGLAHFVLFAVQDILYKSMPDARDRGLRVLSVTCWEDGKNRATFEVKP